MDREKIQYQLNETGKLIASELKPEGFWEGRLSSSALGVAVAVAALHFDNALKNEAEIRKGILWLQKNINSDGSFGDTPESKGNVSTSLLVYAALNLYATSDEQIKETQKKVAGYLSSLNIDIQSPQVE